MSQKVGDHRQALDAFRKALNLARDVKDRESEMTALTGLGVVLQGRGEFARAREHQQGALKIATDLHLRREEATILNDLGGIDLATGRYADAMRQQERALEIARAIGEKDTEAATLNNIGMIERARGNLDRAAKSLDEGLKLSIHNGDREGEARGLINLALVALNRGDFPGAMEKLQKALEIDRSLENRAGEARVLNSMGIAQDSTGHYADALATYQKSLAIFEEVGDEFGKAATLGNVGLVMAISGHRQRALDKYEESLAVQRAIGDQDGAALSLINIGHSHKMLNRPSQARRRFREGLSLARSIGVRSSEMLALTNLADLEESQNNLAAALKGYQKALDLCRAIQDRVEAARILTSIGDVRRKLGDDAAAMENYQQAQALSRSLGDVENIFRTQWGVGDLHRARGRWKPAADAYRAAIDALESIRTEARDPLLQVRFLAQYTTPYQRLADCLLHLGDPAEAFRISERSKARALVDALRGGGGSLGAVLTDQERARGRGLVAELTRLPKELRRLQSLPDADPAAVESLKERIARAQADYVDFRTQTVVAHPELDARRAEFQSAAPVEIRDDLLAHNPDLRILSFLIGEDETLLFVLGPPRDPGREVSLTAHRIPIKRTALEDAVQRLWNACATRDTNYQPVARELYNRLLGPVEGLWKDGAPLVLVPDGILHILPFPALITPKGQHLLERHAVRSAPSVTALLQMSRLRDRRRKAPPAERPADAILAMGFPTYPPGSSLEPLPHTELEVNQIARGFHAQPLTRDRATEEQAKARIGRSAIVHLATHGILDTGEPLNSYVALGASGKEDGNFHAYEIMDLAFRGDLVVLSACSTAGGERLNGEGILGLSWALAVAGAPSTLVTHWQIRSDSSARLMIDFASRLHPADGTSRPSKANALRQAQLALMRDPQYQHPYYWAPFVLIGSD